MVGGKLTWITSMFLWIFRVDRPHALIDALDDAQDHPGDSGGGQGETEASQPGREAGRAGKPEPGRGRQPLDLTAILAFQDGPGADEPDTGGNPLNHS